MKIDPAQFPHQIEGIKNLLIEMYPEDAEEIRKISLFSLEAPIPKIQVDGISAELYSKIRRDKPHLLSRLKLGQCESYIFSLSSA